MPISFELIATEPSATGRQIKGDDVGDDGMELSAIRSNGGPVSDGASKDESQSNIPSSDDGDWLRGADVIIIAVVVRVVVVAVAVVVVCVSLEIPAMHMQSRLMLKSQSIVSTLEALLWCPRLCSDGQSMVSLSCRAYSVGTGFYCVNSVDLALFTAPSLLVKSFVFFSPCCRGATAAIEFLPPFVRSIVPSLFLGWFYFFAPAAVLSLALFVSRSLRHSLCNLPSTAAPDAAVFFAHSPLASSASTRRLEEVVVVDVWAQ